MKVARGIIFVVLGLATKAVISNGQEELPTVYEYFANTSTLKGLIGANNRFYLNGKEIRIISGGMHYFRIHPDLWRDRLQKLRAVGANAVETYVAWNLHEPQQDHFDFGDDGQNHDFSEYTNIEKYIKMAQEEDLLVILRPGPYICGEIDFGGLPSWLQRGVDMHIRLNHFHDFFKRVKIYFHQLLPRMRDLQFTRGGPIVAFQIENEYGSFISSAGKSVYLQFIKDQFDAHGLNESLYFTADYKLGESGMDGSLPGIFQTSTAHQPEPLFRRFLEELQPDMPLMAMEFHVGGFNHWGDKRQSGRSPGEVRRALKEVYQRWNASVNFYMFHGGTNFGFLAGANVMKEEPFIQSDTTSNDFDAPVSEAGDYTEKYDIIRELNEQYAVPKLRRPEQPQESKKVHFPILQPHGYLTYNDLISKVPSTSKFNLEYFYYMAGSMEFLPMNNDSGQSFGYIIYRKQLPFPTDQKVIFKWSYPQDVGFLIVDDEPVSVTNSTDEYWINSIKEVPLTLTAGNHTVDLMVEPLGRINEGDSFQQKGMPWAVSTIELDGVEVTNLEVIALEFKNAWVKDLTGFRELENANLPSRVPILIEYYLEIAESGIGDTWLDMSRWNKGIVFVNGFNIGRYWKIGPQQNLYVPAPLLKAGMNKITVFEQVQAQNELLFSDHPNLGPPPLCRCS